MIQRDELWLERAYESAIRRVAVPPVERWLPRRYGDARGSQTRRLVLAGLVVAALVTVIFYAAQLAALMPKPSGVLNPSRPTRVFGYADLQRVLIQTDEPPFGMHQAGLSAGHPILTYPYGGTTCAGADLPDRNFLYGEAHHFERSFTGQPGYRFLASWAVVYRDPASASDALHAFSACIRATWFSPPEDPGNPKLGDESVIFTGTPLETSPALPQTTVTYMWRVDNMLLSVVYSGDGIDFKDAEDVARTMDGRAK